MAVNKTPLEFKKALENKNHNKSNETIKINPKSRSAKLRVAKRTNSKPLHEIAA